MTTMRISEVDFLVPEIWEGPSDELHLNDVFARGEQPYGERILSGVTSMILGSLPVAEATQWEWPRSLRWDFLMPVVLGTELRTAWDEDQSEVDQRVFTVAVTDGSGQLISKGVLCYGIAETSPTAVLTPDKSTPGRTLFGGDVEIFEWWLGTHGHNVRFAPEVVPWQVLVSLGAGLYINSVGTETSRVAVNRSMGWRFWAPLETAATIRGAVSSPEERRSRSKPGWSVRTGHCSFRREDGSRGLVAVYDATALVYEA